MKKSDKNKIDLEDLTNDMDMIFSYLNKIDNMNLMSVDTKSIKKQALAIEKKIKNKYKGLYNEKNIKNDLDSKK
tara:strand:+ start:577 stop:798 length:222 start_codon:yes stop_codon:yes gene_type:complete